MISGRAAQAEHVDRVRRTAERFFGHDALLPGQKEAMTALLEGCTVVVSPLLALQQDQIHGLGTEHLELRAARISSEESPTRRAEILEQARREELEFLFLAPEQLANPEVRDALAQIAPSLVAVDEAHCVSHVGPRLPARLPPAR